MTVSVTWSSSDCDKFNDAPEYEEDGVFVTDKFSDSLPSVVTDCTDCGGDVANGHVTATSCNKTKALIVIFVLNTHCNMLYICIATSA